MVVISSDAQHPSPALRWHPYLRTTLTPPLDQFSGCGHWLMPELAHSTAPFRGRRSEPDLRARGSRWWRILTDRAAGISVRYADASTPTPCHHRPATLPGVLLRSADCYATRLHRPVHYNPTESVPDRRPASRTRQVPRDRDDWIPIDCPTSSPTGCSRPPATFATDNTKWSSRRGVAGQWLLKGIVKCGVCGVGTSCHKMRGRNGTCHRNYHCRNHDPIRAGGESRRCLERNIGADTLDAPRVRPHPHPAHSVPKTGAPTTQQSLMLVAPKRSQATALPSMPRRRAGRRVAAAARPEAFAGLRSTVGVD